MRTAIETAETRPGMWMLNSKKVMKAERYIKKGAEILIYKVSPMSINLFLSIGKRRSNMTDRARDKTMLYITDLSLYLILAGIMFDSIRMRELIMNMCGTDTATENT
jgi:hypothetical protein